jgi:hypothetical protein
MLKVIGVPKVDWMGMRYYFWAFSIAMMALGVASIVWQGRNLLGIEFSGGTQAVVTFKEGALIGGKLPDDGLVRDLFTAKAGRNDKLTTARVEKIDTDRVSNFLKDHDTNGDGKVTLAEWTAQRPPLDPDYFRQVCQRAKSGEALSRADLDRYLPAKSYQIASTETEAPLIRKVVADAFGEALAERQWIDFDL